MSYALTVPQGVMCALPTGSTIPAGWTRVAALDARHTRGAAMAANAGGSGGQVNHQHPSTAHHHGAGVSHTHASGFTSFYSVITHPNRNGLSLGTFSGSHDHLTPAALAANALLSAEAPAWGFGVAEQPYYSVIWLASDGTPAGFPVGAVVWWPTDTPPAGWTQYAAANGRYLKGAAAGLAGGTTGGSATHHHAANIHVHAFDAHEHDLTDTKTSTPHAANTAGTNVIPVFGPPGLPRANAGHKHLVFFAGGSGATTGGVASADTGAATADPPFTYQLAIQNGNVGPDLPKDAVAPFIGLLSEIPYGYRLCDGAGGLPDLQAQFVKAATNPADVGTTGGGSLAHTHANGGGHHHTAGGHLHGLGIDTSDSNQAEIEEVTGGLIGGTSDYIISWDHAHSANTGPASTSSPNTADDTQDVLAGTDDARPPFTDVLYLAAPGSMVVTITSPTNASTVTVANPTVTWTIPGGETQHSRELLLYADDGISLLYSSGIVTSASLSATLPAGYLRNHRTYYLVVKSLSTTADLGADRVLIQVLFTPSPTVAGLTATAQPTNAPPRNRLDWTQGTISVGQTYVRTNVLRRIVGESAFTRIAILANVTIVSYLDYLAAPGVTYEYVVTTTTHYSLDDLDSDVQAPAPSAKLTFLGVWLHLLADPAQYLLFHAAKGGVHPHQDQRLVKTWGRREPTVHVGPQQWETATFEGAPYGYPDFPGPFGGEEPWLALGAFVAAARAGGKAGLLVVRFGQMHMGWVGVIDWEQSSRDDALGVYTPKLVINKVFYDLAGG